MATSDQPETLIRRAKWSKFMFQHFFGKSDLKLQKNSARHLCLWQTLRCLATNAVTASLASLCHSDKEGVRVKHCSEAHGQTGGCMPRCRERSCLQRRQLFLRRNCIIYCVYFLCPTTWYWQQIYANRADSSVKPSNYQ